MTRTFPSTLKALYEMLAFIKQQAQLIDFSSSQINKIELACEEALVNVINYSGTKDRYNVQITCTPIEVYGLKIVIKDQGIPYNPLNKAKQVMKGSSVDTYPKGGHGVVLIQRSMDQVDYQRSGNLNVLTMIKYKDPSYAF